MKTALAGSGDSISRRRRLFVLLPSERLDWDYTLSYGLIVGLLGGLLGGGLFSLKHLVLRLVL